MLQQDFMLASLRCCWRRRIQKMQNIICAQAAASGLNFVTYQRVNFGVNTQTQFWGNKATGWSDDVVNKLAKFRDEKLKLSNEPISY